MAYRKEIFGVEITGDISGLKSAMSEAVKSFNSTERALKNVEKALKLDPTNVDLLAEKEKLLTKDVQECEKALKKLEAQKRKIERDPNFKEGVTDESERYTELVKKITETKSRLESLKTEYNNYIPAVQKMNGEIAKSKEALDRVNKALANVEEQLKLDPYNVDLLAKKSELLKEKINICRTATQNYRKTHNELVNDPNFINGFDDLREDVTEAGKEMANFGKEAEDAEEDLKKIKNIDLTRFVNSLRDAGDSFDKIAQNTQELSRGFQTLLTTSFKAAISYESSIANIKRVVSDLSDNTIAKLKDIAIETGTAFGDVSEYATFAGALGLAENEVAGFTKTMLDLNTATGGAFGGEEGAKSVVVFLNALGLAIDEAENFGSAIALVGDRYADIGDETLRIATNLSGLSTLAKVDQYDLIGLAGVMANLGLSGEAATSGVTRAFVQIEKAIAGGGDVLDEFAKASGRDAKKFVEDWNQKPLETFMDFVDSLKTDIFKDINKAIDESSSKVQKYAELVGMSSDAFKEQWGKNAENVFNLFADKLAEMDDEGVSAISTLTGVELTSIRTIQTLLRLAGQGDEVAKAVQLANDAWNENVALQDKANGIYDTTERKLQGLFESLKQVGSEIVDVAFPVIKESIDEVAEMLKQFKELDPTAKKLILTFATFGATLSPASRAASKFCNVLADMISSGGTMAFLLSNPAGLVASMIAVSGALATFVLLSEDKVSALNDLRFSIEDSTKAFKDLNTEASNNVREFDYQLARYSSQVDAIDGLIKKIKDETTTEEESAKIKEDLKAKVDELNKSLGTVWTYDETKNQILNEQGDVIELTEAYENLVTTKRKAYYLEQYQDAYNQALKTQKESLVAIADAKWEYAQATKGYTEEEMAFAKYLNDNPLDTEAFKYLASLDKADQAAISSARIIISEYDNVLTSAQDSINESQNLINNYEGIMQAEGDTLESYLDKINNGWNIDPAKNDLEEMRGELEKVNYLLDNPEGISSDVLEELKQRKDALTDEISLTEKARDVINNGYDSQKKKYGEIMNTDSDSIKNTSSTTFDEIKSMWETNVGTMSSEYVTEMKSAYDEFKSYVASNPIQVKINTKTTGPYLGSGGYSGSFFNSGGFGDLYSNMLSSVRNTLSNIQSSGFMSGGMMSNIVMNNSFTINNGANIDKATVLSWADIMTDRINDNLGRQI